MRSKESVMKMFEMRLDGCSFEEIGQHFGITRERVRQILESRTIKGRVGRRISNCVFPGIVNWLHKNDMTLKELCDGTNCLGTSAFYRKMHGELEFNMPQIKAILAFTGLTFEEAFGEEIKSEEK